MQIDIDPTSDVPLYQQLRDRVVEGIATGALSTGEALVSVRQLAASFGINVATVAKGYDLLRQEGLLRTNRKSGSVVARGPESGSADVRFERDWHARLLTLIAEAVAQGVQEQKILDHARSVLTEFDTARRSRGPHHEGAPTPRQRGTQAENS